MEAPLLGTSLMEPALLRALKSLWEGPLEPDELGKIERALRAFFLSPQLRVVRKDHRRSYSDDPDYSKKALYGDYEEPFGDHFLDYEFEHPASPQPYISPAKDESSFLTEFVSTEIIKEASKALPDWITTEGEALAYLDAWYAGSSARECALAAQFAEGDPLYEEHCGRRFTSFESLGAYHPIFHRGPSFDAAYFVGSHRSGLLLFGCSPIAQICANHLFSVWPAKLLERFGEEFQEAARQLRGPGIGISVPPLVSLVLSRARRRDDVPSVIKEFREEYAEARISLWNLLEKMWEAPTLRAQVQMLRQLESAAESIFKAAFPEKRNILSLGITAVKVATGNIAAGLEKAAQGEETRSRVAAISFAEKIAVDFRKDLLSQRRILERHLTEAELREFGHYDSKSENIS
jgi:hypothetical protein